jgi:hypothetical protein
LDFVNYGTNNNLLQQAQQPCNRKVIHTGQIPVERHKAAFEASPALEYKNLVNGKTSGKIVPDGNF